MAQTNFLMGFGLQTRIQRPDMSEHVQVSLQGWGLKSLWLPAPHTGTLSLFYPYTYLYEKLHYKIIPRKHVDIIKHVYKTWLKISNMHLKHCKVLFIKFHTVIIGFTNIGY